MTKDVAFHGIVSGEWDPEAVITAARAEASRVAARQMESLRAGFFGGLPDESVEEPTSVVEDDTE